MEQKERRISTGNSCFLVKDKSLEFGKNKRFLKFLRKNGFESWKCNGYYLWVTWIYINIESKIYAPGMPGICITSVVGNHAITIREFKRIYKIYKKYDNLKILQMSNKKYN